ncbi:hypothetical protein O3M35_009471 [Rhynocoris fuscipes]|uniref:RING-type E3 ubiquitin transferase n=1 Tax=Rhynocoris fuscipes TaxID=488301 RepID=A0AAW1D3V8_9HEMI
MQASADSINWPPEFSELKRLDVILKCGICYDFMNNCMITSCSHTYCSLCIRKFMQYKNQCPTCYEETYEINLRNNRLLDEVILIYTKIRDKLLRASRLASVTVPVKYDSKERKSEAKEILPSSSTANSNVDNKSEKVEEKVNSEKYATPSKKEENKPLLKLSAKDDDSVIVNGVKVPGMFTSPKMSSARPRRPEELTSCPVCEVKVPARNINIHLDSCLALDPAAKPKQKVKRRSPLPKRVYTMMPEKNLKKFLKDYGLSTSGDRKTMINRLQRYTVIYNAENDAVNPRPVSELIKQLEREEREEKKPNSIMKNIQNQTARPAVPKNDVEAIEKANKVYCEQNRASFMKLIEEMRAREGRNIKPLKPTNRIYSDDEDDPNRVDSSVCDNNLPTTSGCATAKEGSNSSPNKEIKYNAVNNDSDSDGDIFVSDTEDQVVKGKIDWNKTSVKASEDGTPDSIYDLITQKPIEEIDLTSEDNNELDENKLSSVKEANENTNDSLSTDYGDSSDGSVYFGTTKTKANQSNKKKKGNGLRKTPRRRLSLSWKKSAISDDTIDEHSSVINEETTSNNDNTENSFSINGINVDDKNFDDFNNESNEETTKEDEHNNSLAEDTEFNGFESTSKTSDEIITEGDSRILNNETINEEISGGDINEDDNKVIEETPLKRLTRSAKRKSMSNQDNKSDDEVLTTPVTRKKTKRDLQDTSPEI